ncbi:MAG: hypothetical protein DIU70_002540 [Bacillota bacterium]|nr:MAG: hypothetical protein DIU70_07885 [Bacillota bacterium]
MAGGRIGQALGLLGGLALLAAVHLEGAVRTVAGAPAGVFGAFPAAAPVANPGAAGEGNPAPPLRPAGKPRSLTQGTGLDGFPDWSPDGRQIAFMRDGRIWLLPAAGGEPRPITGAGRGWDVAPAWSPDGRRIAVVRLDPEEEGPTRVVLVDPAAGREEEVLSTREPVGYLAWAPHGGAIAYTAGSRLEVLELESRRARILVRVGPEEDLLAGGLAWSPDGQWLLYAVGPRRPGVGRYNLFRVPAAGGTPEALTQDGGLMPALAPDGRRLAYRRPASPAGIVVMDLVTGTSAFWAQDSGGVRHFHPRWSPDGQRLALSRLSLQGKGGNVHLSSHLVVLQ